MPAGSGTLQIGGLAKRKLAQVAARARSLGMTPERYLKHLVQEDLAISQQAKTTCFEKIMGAAHEVDERELDRLIEAARERHHQRLSRKG
jgi:1-aminocyclopropane-1-carboxylate deaminase/D-cysteine desulfhydrase-like pyridoxal-dependent ACC family enzyme